LPEDDKMKRIAILALVSLLLGLLVFPVFSTDADRKNVIMNRVFGFQYPLNSDSEYKIGFIDNFDSGILDADFQKIHTNFPKINMIRIPVGWEDMDNSLLIDQMNQTLQIGQAYGFKVIFVIMDRISGWWDEFGPQPWRLMEGNWTDQEARIQNVVEPFKDDDRIYAWALGNELNIFQEVVKEWYGHFLPFIRSIDLNTPITTSFYPLGFNSSTIVHANELVSMGLDFIELHMYFLNTTDIPAYADQILALAQAPILLSEFGTYEGLDTYDVATNKRILNDTINYFENRPNVIGLNYYRWSDDDDPYTIWNQTSQTPRPEGEILNNSVTGFLQQYPYAYMEKVQSNQTVSETIIDPSFQTVVEWPDPGWSLWHNHTSFKVSSVYSTNLQPGNWSEVSVQNLDFESSTSKWNQDPALDQYGINATIVYHGNKALKMWADGTDDYQFQHDAISVESRCTYILSGWINVTETNDGGYAFLSMAFRASNGTWIDWPESEYIHFTTDWINIHVAGVCPENAIDMKILCRTRGNGGNVTAFFDYLQLWKIPHCSYDGRSYTLAWGECSEPSWNVAQISQNFSFANPTEDRIKIWTFSAKIATVQWNEYVTDWKGVYITLAFTSANQSDWISWYDSSYLSFNNEWIQLNVSAIPPSYAEGIQMLVKTSNSKRGAIFIDDAVLTSRPAIIPKNWTIPELTQEGQGYEVNMTFQSINNTVANGTFYGGDLTITESANSSFLLSEFGIYFDNTDYVTTSFTFGSGALIIWMPIMLILGMMGVSMLIITPIYTIIRLRKKDYMFLVWAFTIMILGIGFVIAWLWS